MPKPEKILIVQLCRMGDLVQTLPLLKRLKEEVPTREITLLCIRESMSLIQDAPLVDRFVSIPFSFFKEIRDQSDSLKLPLLLNTPELRESYDLVINLTHDAPSGVISANVRSPKKSGRISSSSPNAISVAGDWGKYLFSSVDARIENLFNLVDIHIGMGGAAHGAMTRWLDVKEDAARGAVQLLCAHGWKGGGRLLALQLGANQPHRAWPLARFAALARRLIRHPGVEIVLLGAPPERDLGEEFARRAGIPAIDLIGNTGLADLPAVLVNCDLLISNDTGTAHIAAAVGTKVLGLYFSTAYFGETAPFGAGHMAVQVELPCCPCLPEDRCETVPCKDSLLVEAVEKAAETMLFDRGDPVPDFPDLGVYRSRFLSNGTMIYAPASATIPERFQTGFLNRMFWETALGLDHDPAFIREFWPRMEHLAACGAKVEAYRREFAYLDGRYREALKLLHNARSPIRSSLEEIESAIARMEKSLMHNFHNYEMMGAADPADPNLRLEDGGKIRKYSKLDGLVKSSLAELDSLCRRGTGRGALGPGLGETLYLGLSSGENFGWGVCGDYLARELSLRMRTVSLRDREDLARAKTLPGRVFQTIKATDFSSLFPARGAYNVGYTFFENILTDAHIRNARQYDAIAAGSTWCRERLAEKGFPNTEVLIQGVDRELFYPIEERKDDDAFVIFSGGKFELRKGQDLVLKAVKILQSKYPDILLVNVWFNMWPEIMRLMSLSPHINFEMKGGSWEEIMGRLYVINGLDSARIITHPIVAYDRLRSIYQNTDLGVFPNRCEGGTNLVLMEYMACAKPVVASYTSGHKDILTEDNSLMLTALTGCRIRDDDNRPIADWEEPSLDELVARIEYAYHHRDGMRELGRRAGEDMKQYTWESAARKAIEIVYR